MSVQVGAPDAFACDQDDCDRAFSTAQGLAKHRSAKHGIAGTSRDAQLRARRKAEVNPPQPRSKKAKQDEVLVVLDVLCPKGIPVTHLNLVNDWMSLTRKMLEVVRG